MSKGRRQRLAPTVFFVAVGTWALACETEVSSPSADGATGVRAHPLGSARKLHSSAWSLAMTIELFPPGAHPGFNTASLDGCPFISRDGRTFYIASTRPGGLGGLDIWVSTRAGVDEPWGEPVNVGAPVNSAWDDFCPTIARDGHLFYFVSRRAGCGGSDVYVTRKRDDGRWDDPEMLPCDGTAPYEAVNSPFDEYSPFPLPERGDGPVLYFSSFRPGGFAGEAPGAPTDTDIYRSESHGGVFGLAELVENVNTASDDGQPNVGSDGLELFFYSTRVIAGVSQGAGDLYASKRDEGSGTWLAPLNLGPNVNGPGSESRPSLSWDGTTLYFGSTRPGTEGSTDIYVTTRTRLTGADK